MDPAIFLDRDGVVIENRDEYVRSWNDVIFLPGALEALRTARISPFRIVVVTNQSAVGRGIISLADAEEINSKFINKVASEGGRLDGLFMCPHSPAENCSCRKPRPGLLFNAAAKMNIDISQSYMIGDALSDLEAGQAAGVLQALLVRTGRGAIQEKLPAAGKLHPFLAFDTLARALAYIHSNRLRG